MGCWSCLPVLPGYAPGLCVALSPSFPSRSSRCGGHRCCCQLRLHGVWRLFVHAHGSDRVIIGTLHSLIQIEARCGGAMTSSCVVRTGGDVHVSLSGCLRHVIRCSPRALCRAHEHSAVMFAVYGRIYKEIRSQRTTQSHTVYVRRWSIDICFNLSDDTR